MFYEAVVTYYDYDEDSRNNRISKFTKTLVCKGENYTDAEVQVTSWASENLNVDYNITPIKELDVINVYPNEKEEGLWFKCRGVYAVVNDVTGKMKEYKVTYLIEAQDIIEATKTCQKILDDTIIEATRVILVQEMQISEYI